MNPYIDFNFYKYNNDFHIIKMTINNITVTPLNWLYTQDYIIENLKKVQNNNDVNKMILYFDINYINLNTSKSMIDDFSKIIKSHIKPMIDKIYGSFIFVDKNIIHLFMSIFKKYYQPIKPLFIINEEKIDDFILSDLLQNKNNINEYKN